jgi:predicted polyphosphate/ATP-dependent NAD kinase
VSLVGIIANPASGKDIRRLVAHALVTGNHEKANIVRRMLIGLHAAGIDRVAIMPDPFGIGDLAIHDLKVRHPQVVAGVQIIDMAVDANPSDTLRAAHLLQEMGARCLVVLGGDGTTRLVSKRCGEIPVLAVSTGTNNVVPRFIEGGVAGLAAGFVAQSDRPIEELCMRSKRLDIILNGRAADSTLVDAAAVHSSYAGARAVWEAETIQQVFVTRASPAAIGFSSIIGAVEKLEMSEPWGLVARVVEDSDLRVHCFLGPGLVGEFHITPPEKIFPGQEVPLVENRPLMLALDGEREISINLGDTAGVRLSLNGPWLVDVEKTLTAALKDSFFTRRDLGRDMR